jgi:hypothetical protein
LNPIGAIVVAFFAVLWVAAGASNFSRRWFGSLLALSILISATIVLAATRVPFGRHSAGFNGRIYGIFVALEAVAILIGVVVINRVGAKQYLMPMIAFIVGAHFFGMVPALHSNEFWWVGGAMCLLALVTVPVLPQSAWSPVVGLGSALILWLSALGAFF